MQSYFSLWDLQVRFSSSDANLADETRGSITIRLQRAPTTHEEAQRSKHFRVQTGSEVDSLHTYIQARSLLFDP